MEFSLVITSAPAHRGSFQSVDCWEVREVSGKLQTNSGTMNSSEDAEEFRGCSSEKSLR